MKAETAAGGEGVTRRGADASFRPWNRKYLGSKRQLREWIAECICERSGAPASFLDGFCGTGAVGFEMARRGAGKVIAVDSLRSNCVILRGFCASSSDEAGRRRLGRLIDALNSLAPTGGYISESYAGTYFTAENCARMDSIREEIERMRIAGEITGKEHDCLLASFLLAADRVANTLGQYDAFLKNIAGESMVSGRHLRDDRVKTPFRLRALEPVLGKGLEVVEGDMGSLAGRIKVEVAYYDPPYNGRQYIDNYHVLENLARWEKPRLQGKTMKFDRTGLKSAFSRRRGAAPALGALIERTRAPRIFLSYSSEGILSREEILGVLERRGHVEMREIPYPVFGNGAGVSSRRSVREYLFLLETVSG